MKDFFDSDMGRWVMRLGLVILASLVKAGYIPLPIEVLGNIDLSNPLLGGAALIPSRKK